MGEAWRKWGGSTPGGTSDTTAIVMSKYYVEGAHGANRGEVSQKWGSRYPRLPQIYPPTWSRWKMGWSRNTAVHCSNLSYFRNKQARNLQRCAIEGGKNFNTLNWKTCTLTYSHAENGMWKRLKFCHIWKVFWLAGLVNWRLTVGHLWQRVLVLGIFGCLLEYIKLLY